jgi:phospholipid transport system transporter-binding protein
MKARRKPSGARATAAKKPAVARKRTKAATSVVAKRRPASGASVTPEALGTDCTIEHAPALHKRLAKIVANRACVTLDLAAVKRCDTAGIQVLVAFVRERREAGRDVELRSAPEAILSAARLLGLTAMLGLAGSEAQAGHA